MQINSLNLSILKMSREILDHVDDDLGIINEEALSIDPHIAKKIKNVSLGIMQLQKIMGDRKHP